MPLIWRGEYEQPAASNRPYEVDVGAAAVPLWAPNASVPAAAFLRPRAGHETGYIYQNGSTPGQSGPLEPAWPTTGGGTVTDGSLTLTAAVPPADGEDAIASVTWTQVDPPDSDLTISGEANDSLTASAFIGGGTSGNVYTVQAVITMTSSAVYVGELVITIL